MTRIILDSATCEQLISIDGSAELCDEQGHIVGYFLAGDRKPGQPPPGFEIPLSIEEIEKLRGARTGRTLKEILKGLDLQ